MTGAAAILLATLALALAADARLPRALVERGDDADDGLRLLRRLASERASNAATPARQPGGKAAEETRTTEDAGRSRASSRQHKAFFVDYPVLQRVYTERSPTPASGKKPKKKDSEIFYIRLPPAPYSYVPGLGYISQPPTFSASSLLGGSFEPPPKKPLIKLPTKFVSNGKPVGVYSWKDKAHPNSPVIRLNRGPYVFDGRPGKIYVLPKDARRRT